jgi:hypothetical protein
VRISIIGILLLLGALFGVQQMNEALGISQPVPLLIEKKESSPEVKQSTSSKVDSKVEAGPTPKIELVEKRKTAEEVGRFNFFSDMGNYIAEGMNYVSRSLLSQVMSFVNNVLNGESEE